MCDHQCCRHVLRNCATCALSTFVRGNTHLCGLEECARVESDKCDEWLPLVVPVVGRQPRVFGDLDEQPCN